MKKYDVIVIGSGAGLNIATAAAEKGFKTVVIDDGPAGGTCLNRGCIPSKIIIRSAEVAQTINDAEHFGIATKKAKVNFKRVTSRASKMVDGNSKNLEKGIKATNNLTRIKGHATFITNKTISVNNDILSGKKIFIGAGTRPFIPPIKGINDVPFLTSKQALRLTKQPKTLTIIGGGYIAAEMAHFFQSLGTKVTIIQRDPTLIPREDQEIVQAYMDVFRKKCTLVLNAEANEVKKVNDKILTIAKTKTGATKKIMSNALLLAVGRVSNADKLGVQHTDIKLNKHRYIVTNRFLETNVKGVWAFGDIAGKYLFRHSANLEASTLIRNVFSNNKKAVDYYPMPHAIFTSPEIAGVGLTEQECEQQKLPYVIGRYDFIKSGKGRALHDTTGFAKIIVHKKTRKILGCHILGTDAASLIHEVIIAMKAQKPVDILLDAVHIHPALSEVVQRAARNIDW